ncbi:hypothetical protein [Solirubrum puertoriconensis]|uniref:Glycerophosphoryl diester phosphodiesterase membrane domain-containing protein n=1 Tax=Solirubrum puertoriconensis TaxID=1751427 RepID=A0A9X0HJC7_SOLP1|nr:hypothetical protein [Solirubrum puertoriconensis]KUG06843.1 hypothetical protein ASU33_05825 [Solirubrum puertoriconensis]
MPTLTTAKPTAGPPPFSHPADFYQVRDFGQKWEATAQLLRLHYKELFGVLVRYAGLYMLIGALFQAAGEHFVGTDGAMLFPVGTVFYAIGSFVGTGVVYGFLRARMHALDEPGARYTPDQIWDFVNGLGSYFGSNLIFGALMGLGFLCLIIPGIYIWPAFTLLPAVVMLEDGEESLSRCFKLVERFWWTTFGLALMAALLQVGTIQIPEALLQSLGAALEIDQSEWFWVLPVRLLISTLQFLLQPITAILMAFNYFSIVESKESPGLSWRASRIGQAPAATSQPHDLGAVTEGEYLL